MKWLGGVIRSLARKRTVLLPTWRGWLLLLLVVVLPGLYAFRHLGEFLSLNTPLPEGVPVVEGWLPDNAMYVIRTNLALAPGRRVFVTGGPVEEGGPLSVYKNLADLGAAIMIKYGFDSNSVQSVPTPFVYKDRTYTSASTLRKWFLAHGGVPAKINLISMGAHSRRSRLLFAKAFGPDVQVGVTAVQDDGYDVRHWWRTSQGVRTVTSEFIAYVYARFLFSD